jgi:hypothetical protein
MFASIKPGGHFERKRARPRGKKPSKSPLLREKKNFNARGNRARRTPRDLYATPQTPPKHRPRTFRTHSIRSRRDVARPNQNTLCRLCVHVPLVPISPTSCTGSRRPCRPSLCRRLGRDRRLGLCRLCRRRVRVGRLCRRRDRSREKILLCQILQPLLCCASFSFLVGTRSLSKVKTLRQKKKLRREKKQKKYAR